MLRQLLADFENSVTETFSSFAGNLQESAKIIPLKISSHFKLVATLRCEILMPVSDYYNVQKVV